MEARASFGGAQLSPSVVRLFLVALLAVFLLGGAGGYLVRGSSTSVSNPTTTIGGTGAHHPYVIEPAPYSTPALSPAPEPAHDPSGRVISV